MNFRYQTLLILFTFVMHMCGIVQMAYTQIDATSFGQIDTKHEKIAAQKPIWEEIKNFKKDPDIKQQLKIKDPFLKNMSGLIDTINVVNDKEPSWDRVLQHLFLNIFPGGILRLGLEDGLVLLTQEKAPQVFNLIKELCQKMELPMPVIFLSGNKKMFNAFASSFTHNLSLIVLGQALLKKLNTDELRSVLAHELSHIKHSHVPQQLALALTGNIVIPIALLWWLQSLDDGTRISVTGTPNRAISLLKSWPGQLLVLMGASIGTTLLLLSRSRVFEKAADMTALEVTQDHKSFISMIEKIEEKVLKKKNRFEESHDVVVQKITKLSETSPKIAKLLSWMLESHYNKRIDAFDSILEDETADHPSCKMRKAYAEKFGLERNDLESTIANDFEVHVKEDLNSTQVSAVQA